MNTKSILIITLLVLGSAATLLVANTPKHKDEPVNEAQVRRGEYLVSFGDCAACHTPLKSGPNGPEPDMSLFLSGHPGSVQLPPPGLKEGPWFAATAGMTAWAGPWGISYAANLTPDTETGLGIWTEEMFINTMRTGKHMGAGRPILPPMPWRASAGLSDEDLKAIFAYLKTLKPVRNRVPLPIGPDGQDLSFE